MTETIKASNLQQLAEEQKGMYDKFESDLQQIRKDWNDKKQAFDKVNGKALQSPTVELFREKESLQREIEVLGQTVSSATSAINSHKREKSRALSYSIRVAEIEDFKEFQAVAGEKEAAILNQLEEAIKAFREHIGERNEMFEEVRVHMDQARRYLEREDLEEMSWDAVQNKYVGGQQALIIESLNEASKAIAYRKAEL
jgi:hypothetical protein